ncbi:MAG: protein kinase, partial [Inquilinus sp.]|nr:protein kinase [Inquilinus sp.]
MTQTQAPGASPVDGPGPPIDGALPNGHRLGDYVIERAVGRGAYGIAYRARDSEGHPVAVKVFAPEVAAGDGAAAGRARTAFRQEADMLGGLDHPGIVKLRAVEAAGPPPYLVLDWLEGANLESTLAQAPDSVSIEALLPPLLEAVGHVHAAGYLHRDLKPGNIQIVGDGRPVLIDFGAVSPIAAADRPPRSVQATPGYGAPEQYLADGREGPWTDVYGLAAVAYRVLAGAAPEPAARRIEGAVLAPAVEAACGMAPPAVLAAIDRALELDPGARPQTIVEFARSLATAWGGGDAISPKPVDRPVATGRRPAPDDFPPTEEVTRIKPPTRRRPFRLDTVPADAPGTRTPGSTRPAGGGGLRWAIAAVVALALVGAGVSAGVRWGWPYYLRNIKSEWVVDATGAGDVRTIAEALEWAKEGALIEVRAGDYPQSLTMPRPVTLTGVDRDGDGRPAAIVAPAKGR